MFIYLNKICIHSIQKNNDIENLIKEAILNTIRDNIPVERILKCYMEETEDVEFTNEIYEKKIIIIIRIIIIQNNNNNNNNN